MEKTLGHNLHGAFSHGTLKMANLWRHNRVVSEVAVMLNLEFGDELHDWCTDSDARGPIEIPAGRKRAVEPDLLACLTVSGVARCWWLEVDLASEPETEIVRKARACDAYYRSPDFRERWGVERLRILWVAASDERAKSLRDWIGRARPRVIHHFAALDAARREGLRGEIWLAVNGRDQRVCLVAPGGGGPPGHDEEKGDE